jgi:hypothetical protein
MHGIYELKEMLCKELEEYGEKGELSAGTLDIVDKLSHSIKNLDKIIETYEEEEYSNYGGSYADGDMPYRDGGYNGGRSYARGRGRNARRDSMGCYSSRGYSRAGDMVDQLRKLMNDAPDDRTRQKIQNLVSEMEMM